jgi:ribonuclease BN (tRNA processing enzyme)
MSASLVLLGTGAGPTPKPGRNAPAQALVVDGHTYLVDCGNGVTPQLVRAQIPLSSLVAVFLTHHHSDHNADIGTMFPMTWSQLRGPVEVFGPPPLDRMLDQFFVMQDFEIQLRAEDEGMSPLRDLVRTHEITANGLIYEDASVRVTATLVNHPPMAVALGYRFDTLDRSIVISGDTTMCQSLIDLAAGADVLVHEAMYLPALESRFSQYSGRNLLHHLRTSHTTVEEAGDVARAAAVKTLVLSHLTPADSGVDDETWRSCARLHFDGEIIVGRDLMVI